MGCEPRCPVTPTALRAPAGPHAGWGGARGRGFPGSKCGSVRVPPQAPASAAAGWPGRARRRRRGLGPGARPRGTRCCANQLQAGPAPPRPGDPARRAGDNVRRPGGGTGSGRAACAVHFLFSARGLPPPRARPACRAAPPLAAGSLIPGTRRGGGTQRARPPAGRAAPAEPPPELRRAAERRAQLPGRSRLRLLLPPLRPISPRRGTGRVPGSGLVRSAAQDYIYTHTVPLSPDCPLRRRHGRVVFQSTVFPCTCLSDHLWEPVGGADRVDDVASLCKRKKTLSPRGRPLPRVTRRETENQDRLWL